MISPRRPPAATDLLAVLAAAFVALTVAAATLAAGWTPGGGLLPLAALLGAAAGAALAFAGVTGDRAWVVALALESGVFAAVVLTGFDVHALPFGLDRAATAIGPPTQLQLALLYGLTWSGSSLLGWTAAARTRPIAGLAIPIGLLAVDVLNHPDGQQPYVIAALAATLVLLMSSQHARLLAALGAGAPRSHRFWASGAAIAAAVLAVAALLPPASSEDATTSGGWVTAANALRAALGAGPAGTGGASATVGLSTSAGLLGGLTEGSNTALFTYTPDAASPGGPYYFRAVDLAQAAGGEWEPLPAARPVGLAASTPVAYAEDYAEQVAATVKVHTIHPLASPSGLVVYPGRLVQVDRVTYTRQSTAAAGALLTLDTLQSRVSGGDVVEQVGFANATASELRAAGTGYPDWVKPYAGELTRPGYRSAAALAQVAQLARDVAAGAGNPYDAATAVETYLRSNFTYTLTPPDPPAGTDPLLYFLFTSRQGYCQYFAIAMGDMLRALGIPTRLVNGFGPGTADSATGAYTVSTGDAHTWVEVYFPTYGWITFEPTPDGTYFPIPRAAETPVASEPAPDAPAAAQPAAPPAADPISQGVAWISGRRADIPWAVVLLLLGVLAAGLAAASAARPRSAAAAWGRLRLLASVAGVAQRPGETPLEFGVRLGHWRPALAPEVEKLAQAYSAAAYAPPEAAARRGRDVVGAWRALRLAAVRNLIARARRRWR